MKRWLLLIAITTILPLLTACTIRPPAPDRLLFVVPQQLPDGQTSALRMDELEEWIATQTGGFTRIDAVEGGWIAPDGSLVRESNALYLLSLPPGTPDSFHSELEGRILYGFEQQEAWIQRW